MGKIYNYDKFYESLRTKNFKDMENWTVKGETKVSKSRKKLEMDNGEKFIELFEKYNIRVGFGAGEIAKSFKFGDEKTLREIRIGLYPYTEYDEWLVHNGYTEDYIDKDKLLSDEEYKKEYEEYKNNDSNECITFSVFLGSNNNQNNLELCMSDAYLYLKEKLKDINIYSLIEGYDFTHINEVKQYINNINFNINKNNLEEITNLTTRLRQDSKVFVWLEEEYFNRGSGFSYNDFVNDLKNL